MTDDTFPLGERSVRRIGFGAMQLAGPGAFGPPHDRDAALDVLRKAVELGVNHVDTAQYYGPDVVNELIRTALRPYPEDLVIVSKVGAARDDVGRWLPAMQPEQLRAGVQENLRSLGVERLDAVNLRLMDGGQEFDAELDGFEVPADVLERPLALSNSALRAYFERQCQEAAARFEADAALTGRVRRQIIAGMNGQVPSMQEVARALGLSVRSLHRGLEAEGVRWSELVDGVRSEFAQRYLARPSLNIGEVSYLVGFSDTSAFFKAFKRWTGKKPSEYRESLAG